MDKNINVSCGGGSSFIAFLTFLVLKLTGVISWSWWWVTAPLWGGLALFIVLYIIILLFAIFG